MWCRNNNFLIIRHCLRCKLIPRPGPLPYLGKYICQFTMTLRRTSYRRNVTTSARRNSQIAKSQRMKQHATTSVVGEYFAGYSKFILYLILLSSMFHRQMRCRNNNFLIMRHCLRCVLRPATQLMKVRELPLTMRRTVCQRNVTTSARSISLIVPGSKNQNKNTHLLQLRAQLSAPDFCAAWHICICIVYQTDSKCPINCCCSRHDIVMSEHYITILWGDKVRWPMGKCW